MDEESVGLVRAPSKYKKMTVNERPPDDLISLNFPVFFPKEISTTGSSVPETKSDKSPEDELKSIQSLLRNRVLQADREKSKQKPLPPPSPEKLVRQRSISLMRQKSIKLARQKSLRVQVSRAPSIKQRIFPSKSNEIDEAIGFPPSPGASPTLEETEEEEEVEELSEDELQFEEEHEEQSNPGIEKWIVILMLIL